MRRFLSALLCIAAAAAACVVFSACEKQKDDTNAAGTDSENGGVIDGGWSRTESVEVSDKIKALFEKASAEKGGSSFVPVACLESQVVAGFNHLALCRVAHAAPDASETYALVTLYEDPDGNAEITDVRNSGATALFYEGMTGSWVEPESPVPTDDAKAALAKACETLTGAEYKPVALLGTQVVAGTNYRILCESRHGVSGAASEYLIVTVYADLCGNAVITETYGFEGAEIEPVSDPAE